MNNFRVLFISRAYGEKGGGMERLSFEFVNAAKENPQIRSQEIVNYTRANEPLFLTRIRSAFFALRVIPSALLAARKSDVVHIGDPVLSLVGWLIQVITRKPIVVTVHGLDITYDNPLYQWYLRLFFSKFALYLPISTYVRELLAEHNIPTSKIHILTPGIIDRYFDPSATRDELAKTLRMPADELKNKTILLTVGRLVSRKGHAWFIRNVLPSLPSHYIYIIAGSGPEAAEIAFASEEARQIDRVFLLGRVSDNKLATLYNTADIFVQPNIPTDNDTEGFGLVLLEAALSNCLVVASDLEGIQDAISNMKNGILVPPKDAKKWITTLSDKNVMQAIESPRDYTHSTFSWERKIRRYINLLTPLKTS